MRKEYGTAAGWAHLNIVHSHFGARALIHSMKKSYKNPTCKVLYPPIDLEVFKPISKEGLREKYTTKDRFTVLLVARNQYRKNFPVLIEAVKRLSKTIPNIQLLMVAAPTISPFGAPEGYDLAAIVDEEGVKEYISSVRTNRMVDEKTLNEIYNSADILCLPSFGEGFGLPIAEAFAVGIPVVATNCSSITELLSDDRGILVNPSATIWQDGFTKHAALNSEKLANAIFKAYQDQALRDRCVAESGKFIRALEKNLITAELIKMFEKVIEDDVQPTAVEGL
jgi:glycosyltransferase involved in cell wall biosynthesis